MTHVKLINENTALAPVGSNDMFRLGEGPSTERRTVCLMLGSRLVAEKRLKHANGPKCSHYSASVKARNGVSGLT